MQVPEHKVHNLIHQIESVAGLGTWETDLITMKSRWSDGLFRLLGYEPQEFEVTKETWVPCIHEDDQEHTLGVLQDAIDGKSPYEVEKRLIKKCGTVIHVVSRGEVERDADGKPLKMFGIIMDITKQKVAEKQVKASRDRLESLIHSVDGILWEGNPDNFQFSFVSPQSKQILGYEPEEWMADPEFWISKIHPDDRKMAYNFCVMMTDRGEDHAFEYRMISADGREVWCRDYVSVKTENGKPVMLRGLIVDITKQKKAEFERRMLVDNTEEAFILVDKDYRVTSFNREYQRLYREIYGGELHLGEKVFKYIPADRQQHAKKLLSDALDGKSNELVRSFRERSGREGIFRLYYKPAKDDSGNIIGVFVSTTDITEKKKAENQLALSLQRHEHLTGIVFDAVWDYDPASQNMNLSKRFEKMFGIKTKDKSRNFEVWRELIHPDDRRRVLKNLADLSAGKSEELQQDYRLMKSGDSYFWLRENAVVMRNAEGEILRVLGALQDITEQRQAEREQFLMVEISRTFSETPAFIKAAEMVLSLLSEEETFSSSGLWVLNPDKKSVALAASKGRNETLRMFLDSARVIDEDKRADTLIGKVWESGKPVICESEACNRNFAHLEIAEDSVAKTLAGYPVMVHNQPVGVLLFTTEKPERSLVRFTDLMKRLSTHLGTEIRRKASEEDLNQIFMAAPDIICIAGKDGYFKRINPAASELLEYTEEELLSRPYVEFTHPDDRNKTLEVAGRDAGSKNFENRYITKNGNIVWLEWTASMIPETGMVYGIARNITEYKKLKFLVDKATELARIGSWEADLRGQKQGLYVSGMMQDIIGDETWQPETTEQFIEIFEHGYRDKVRQGLEKVRSGGDTFDTEAAVITASGRSRWVRFIAQAEIMNGECVRLYGSLQDIHQRKTAETAFKKEAEEKIEVLESIRDNFYALDRNYCFTYVNQTCLNYLGKTRDELIGKNLFDEFPYLKGGTFYDALMKAEKTGKAQQFEAYYEPFDSWYDDSIYSRPDGYSVFFRDITDRKSAEIELLKFKKVIENSPDGIGIASIDGTVLFMNEGLKKMTGHDEQSLTAAGGPSACYADPVLGEEMFETLGAGNYWSGDVLVEAPDGRLTPVYLSAGPVMDEDGKLVAVFGLHTDITERIRAEDELKSAFNERKNILERITEAFFALDKDWNVTYWNHEAENIIGVKREKLIGKNLWEHFPLARQLRFFKEYERAFKEQIPVHFEEYFPPMDKWFEANGYPSPEGISVFFRDVTRKKKSEDLIKQSNERFEKVAEATNDAIWDWNIEGETLYMGRGFKTLFGCKSDSQDRENKLDDWSCNIHADDQSRVINKMELVTSLGSSDTFREEYRYQRADGSYAYVIHRGVVIRDENKKAIRMVGALTDISYRKVYEDSLKKLNEKLKVRARELAASNAELEQFAYIASHDLQEPLRMITSFLAQLERKYADQLDDKARTYIHFAVDGARRMRLIILDLLEFSRVGKYQSEPKIVDLNISLKECIGFLKSSIEETGAEITSDDLPEICSFASPIGQIFQNLLGNSIKYRKDDVPPKIHISCDEVDDCWRIRISDNGIGIDEAYHERIFNIFQRLHNKDEYSGTGMGLAIVKKITESLGGRVYVESAEGEGSTFFIQLPKTPQVL